LSFLETESLTLSTFIIGNYSGKYMKPTIHCVARGAYTYLPQGFGDTDTINSDGI